MFAPGATIYSTMSTSLCNSSTCLAGGIHLDDSYHSDLGSSIAVPYVVGVASLIMSKFPNITISALRERILAGVDIKSNLVGKCYTGGRLNAEKAVCTHNYYATIEPYDNMRHKCICTCGSFIYGSHSLYDVGGMLVCSGCGYMEYY